MYEPLKNAFDYLHEKYETVSLMGFASKEDLMEEYSEPDTEPEGDWEQYSTHYSSMYNASWADVYIRPKGTNEEFFNFICEVEL